LKIGESACSFAVSSLISYRFLDFELLKLALIP